MPRKLRLAQSARFSRRHGAVVEGGDDPATLVVEEAPELVVALAADDAGPRWLQPERGEAVGVRVDGRLPLVGVRGVTVAAHALADGFGGGSDEPVAGVVEGHDAGGHATVEGLAGRAIELRLELERACSLERRHQGRTLGQVDRQQAGRGEEQRHQHRRTHLVALDDDVEDDDEDDHRDEQDRRDLSCPAVLRRG